MSNIQVFITQDDLKQAPLYWGKMPLPVGGELIGLVARGPGEIGAAIKLNGYIYQGNRGTLRATGCRL